MTTSVVGLTADQSLSPGDCSTAPLRSSLTQDGPDGPGEKAGKSPASRQAGSDAYTE